MIGQEEKDIQEEWLENAVANGDIILTRDKLLPPAQAAFDKETARLGYEPPVILAKQITSLAAGEFLSLPLKNGKTALYVGEAAHRWTEDYAKKEAVTDQALAAARKVQDPRTLEAYQKLVGALDINPPPVLVEDLSPNQKDFGASGKTAGGTAYIVIKANFSFEQSMGLLAHEVGHIKRGDVEFAAVAAQHNDTTSKLNYEAELAADQYAVRLCQGDKLESALEYIHNSYVRLSRMSAEEYDKQPNPTHPPFAERVALVRASTQREINLGHCPAPEGPSPTPNCKPGAGQSCGR